MKKYTRVRFLFYVLFFVMCSNCAVSQIFKSHNNNKPVNSFIKDVEMSINNTLDDIEEVDVPLPNGMFLSSKIDYTPRDYYFPFKHVSSGYKFNMKKHDLRFVTAYDQHIDLHIYVKFRLKLY